MGLRDENMISLEVKVGDRWYVVEIDNLDGTHARVLVDGEPIQVDLASFGGLAGSDQHEPALGGPVQTVEAVPSGDTDLALVRAPMPGVILSIQVSTGDVVSEGVEMCVLEAMKMEHSLLSPRKGSVKTIYVSQGQNVLIGEPIIELE